MLHCWAPSTCGDDVDAIHEGAHGLGEVPRRSLGGANRAHTPSHQLGTSPRSVWHPIARDRRQRACGRGDASRASQRTSEIPRPRLRLAWLIG
jgi:hypothetical protein